MDTLWASLIGLFVIAIAVVLAFNLLQGRQTRLRDAFREKLAGAGRPAARPHAPAPRAEPTVGGGASAPATPAAPTPGQRIEPTLGPSGPRPAPPVPAAPSEPRATVPRAAAPEPIGHDEDVPTLEHASADDDEPGFDDETATLAPDGVAGPILDPRLDCIVVFGLGAPIAPERLLGAASTLRRAGSKPIAVEADVGDGRWSVPQASFGAVRRARAGVLLANRHGPLNAMEFSEFASAMQALGRAIGAGGAIVPDMGPVLDHARQLDEACAQLDAVIGLNVETPTALSPADLAALAGGLGLLERGNTRFAALGDEGEVLFSLALGERAEQLTLLLDVPRAPEHLEPWQRMVEAARACAERTGGQVVDDANRPLTDAAAAEVERQLAMRYRTLHEAGLDAGSPAALRVFN
jgi:hypothetical protein